MRNVKIAEREDVEIAGWILAVFVGLSLGLMGGGGSILCVPIFVYLFGFDTDQATSYSLFVVGVSSIAGTFKYLEEKLVSVRALVSFGLPALVAVYANRMWVNPAIPQELGSFGEFIITKDMLVMLLFAGLMVPAARIMIKGRDLAADAERSGADLNYAKIVVLGLLVGFVTSLIGAGGGFLIIPALVLLFKMPVKRAIGTSLSIIMVNSLIGFSGDIGADLEIDWLFLMKFTGLAVAGIFIGIYLSHSISGQKLKPAFGWFVLVMGIIIIVKELIMKPFFDT